MAIGCAATSIVVVVLLVGFGFAASRSIDWGPPSRGMASGADLRPLPDGVEEAGEQVGENGSCGGNGKGWHLCERRLRVRMAGKSQADLAKLLADHYSSLGHEMVEQSRGSGSLFGPRSCPPGDGLCLYVDEPDDRSSYPSLFDHIREKPAPGDVEIVANTWSYYV